MTLPRIDSNEATYFGYGTLLELEEMRKYCPSAQPLGIYRLKDYRLGFASCGPDPAIGGCTLEAAPGNTMYGILYKMPLSERLELDRVSGIEQGLWSKMAISLIGPHGDVVAADTFFIPSPSGEHKPSASYTRPILAGARSIPLPLDYIAQLESIVKAAQQEEAKGNRNSNF